MSFKDLHQQESPLLIANVWDAASAQVAEKLNAQALGTSSAAIAKMLGYNDGEEMPFSELSFIAKRIKASSSLPLSVDIESGYSRDPLEIAKHIKELAGFGVVGINIEDSLVDNGRQLLDADAFAKTLSAVKEQLEKDQIDLFLNVRTDTFILGLPDVVNETKKRIRLYEDAGASGIFVPCIEKEDDIKAVVEHANVPINVMCMPKLPNFETLQALGVKRISMGNFFFDNTVNHLEQTLSAVINQQSFSSIF